MFSFRLIIIVKQHIVCSKYEKHIFYLSSFLNSIQNFVINIKKNY